MPCTASRPSTAIRKCGCTQKASRSTSYQPAWCSAPASGAASTKRCQPPCRRLAPAGPAAARRRPQIVRRGRLIEHRVQHIAAQRIRHIWTANQLPCGHYTALPPPSIGDCLALAQHSGQTSPDPDSAQTAATVELSFPLANRFKLASYFFSSLRKRGIWRTVKIAGYELYYDAKFGGKTGVVIATDAIDGEPEALRHASDSFPSSYLILEEAFSDVQTGLARCGAGRFRLRPRTRVAVCVATAAAPHHRRRAVAGALREGAREPERILSPQQQDRAGMGDRQCRRPRFRHSGRRHGVLFLQSVRRRRARSHDRAHPRLVRPHAPRLHDRLRQPGPRGGLGRPRPLQGAKKGARLCDSIAWRPEAPPVAAKAGRPRRKPIRAASGR